MCELSDFYLKLVKENSNPNPEKPIMMLRKEDYEKLIRFLSKKGKKL